MTTALLTCAVSSSAWSAAPEPVDPEFLDYLATVEGKDDNWTVVASDRERKKAAAREPKVKAPPDEADKPAEKKP